MSQYLKGLSEEQWIRFRATLVSEAQKTMSFLRAVNFDEHRLSSARMSAIRLATSDVPVRLSVPAWKASPGRPNTDVRSTASRARRSPRN